MKNKKLILLTAIIISMLSSVVIISSCSKSSCGSIICQNSGFCADGKCTCPTGFSGNLCQTRAKSAIQYINNTFTPITISVNGTSKVIPVGGATTFAGQYALSASMTASTSGTAGSLGISNPGAIIGLTINWSRIDSFPLNDTLRVPLDVGATYFFLKMSNTRSGSVIDYYVNVNFTNDPDATTYEDITVPNNGTTYNMGYYLAYNGSNVQIQTSDSKVVWKAVTLPFTSNQSFTANF